jgi:outer membrane protein assembly factor BamB
LLLPFAASLHAQAKRPSSLLPPRAPSGGAVLVPASVNDWPTFRGADRTDVSKESGLLKQWPAEGPKKAWVFDKAGLGYSGYAIVAGTLYTTGANDNGEEELIAINAENGTEKWRTVVGGRLSNGWGDGPRATPTVDGDRVYAMGGKGELLCASVRDGKQVWKASMTSDFGGKVPGWGYTESVLVDGDNVICTPGSGAGTLVALNKLTGAKVWQSSDWTDGAQYSSAVAADINGTHQIVQHTMNSIAGVDAKDGKVLWKQAFPQGKTAVIPTPIVKGNSVYMVAGYNAGCMKLDIGPKNEVKVAYENTEMVNHHGGVILVGDYLYGYSDKGGWTCQDFQTGAVVWAEKGKLGKGAIHCADGMLYLLEENSGTVVLIEASPDGWKEHGRFKLDPQTTQRSPKGKIWTHPVVSNGRLYLRDQELLFSFDVKSDRRL